MNQSVHLKVLSAEHRPTPAIFPTSPDLLSELQVRGLSWSPEQEVGLSRVGGAGPSDHKALRIGGQTLMVPIFTRGAQDSPFELGPLEGAGEASLLRFGTPVATVQFVETPRFYALKTSEGIPYFKIATLHSDKVLATTVLQNCVRFAHRDTSCQFCAIGQSLGTRRTIPRKSPTQLAEVAEAAVRLDAVEHMVLTTGTPPGDDRGALLLTESAAAIRARVALPLQAQCEPPEDPSWYLRLKEAGVATLGMHLEAVTEPVRHRIMPGKAEVSVERYFRAFEQAVAVFGRGQVTTYILAGLGDPADAIVETTRALAAIGVYAFVVPFVPIAGTPLENHPPPDAAFMADLLDRVAEVLARAKLFSQKIQAGCGRCGACSTLRSREPGAGEVVHA